MEWVRLYVGSGPADAWLVRDWLERNGLDVRVHGDLSSVRGEIPVDQSWPSVWIRAADRARADAALRVLQGPRLVRSDWTCPSCGEVNGPAFDACWSCEQDRPPDP